MKKTIAGTVAALTLVLAGAAWTPAAGTNDNWPQWRGPQANGVGRGNPPVEWSEQKNILWKVDLPGLGHGSPVVWGDKIFVTTAIATEDVASAPTDGDGDQGGRRRGPQPPSVKQRSVVFAIDRRTGKTLWERTADEELPKEGHHQDNSYASHSAITDGEHVFAYFGSRGLYCYDLDGNLVWQRDFGEMQSKRGFGEGSSPTLHKDKVIVLWDHEGPSFITALNKSTGQTLWKTDRDEETSWSTPLVVEVDGKAQVVTSATSRIRSYDLENGELIWESSGMTANTIPSPVVEDGVLYVTSGFRGNSLMAIRLSGAKGDITGTEAILWQYDRNTPYVPSPLLYDSYLYFLKSNNAILSCFHAKTGEPCYPPQRLAGPNGVYASPVGAGDRVYIAGRNGVTAVLKKGSEFEVLATNTLDDRIDASPAIVGDTMYIRGHKHLYAIAE